MITWAPVSTQLLFASGFCACGSVFLASVRPASMYMKPTLFLGGSFLFSQASTHSIAFWSAHIGSGPGVLGLSAMHVNWLLPWRTTRIFPSLLTSMIVAPLPIASGAADMALFITSSSVTFPDGLV